MTQLRKRFERQIRFLQNRLSPEGYAGLHLTVGVIVVLLCGWCFGAIAEDVFENDTIVQVDQQIALWFHQHATHTWVQVARAVSFFGSVAWVGFVSSAIALYFGLRRQWLNATVVSLTMFGGSALNLTLKHLFHRGRPVLENPFVTLSSYGFPSGHTMGATMLYGLLALFAWRTAHNRARRMIFVMAATLLIIAIGFTRIYLGAHYLTDVLGAFAAGLLWLTFCWTAVETLRRRKA